VSYGWQGNLTQINCKTADVTVVDDNFAKLAAKGISVMISSGDSGSGYSSQNNQCMGRPGAKNVGIDGTVLRSTLVEEVQQCCEEGAKAAGWTFVPAKKELESSKPKPGKSFSFKDSMYHTEMGHGPFKQRDVLTLNGEVKKAVGTVKAHNMQGTFKDLSIDFGPAVKEGSEPESIRNVSATIKGTKYEGQAHFIEFPGQPVECFNIEWRGEGWFAVWERGPNPPPPPPPGRCTLYSKVTKKTSSNDTTFSGFAPTSPALPVLWPSWPASSPWVTSVGATRFIGQKVGNEEMATDQFGSGGGFSKQFAQEPNAKWQQAAVAKYLKTVDQSTLPPAGSSRLWDVARRT